VCKEVIGVQCHKIFHDCQCSRSIPFFFSVQDVFANPANMSEQLKIASWNVWGLNSPTHCEAVKAMVQSVNPMLICLQEAKIACFFSQLVTETLGPRLDGYSYLLANGTRGGHSSWMTY
jgi:hypothetical protein